MFGLEPCGLIFYTLVLDKQDQLYCCIRTVKRKLKLPSKSDTDLLLLPLLPLCFSIDDFNDCVQIVNMGLSPKEPCVQKDTSTISLMARNFSLGPTNFRQMATFHQTEEKERSTKTSFH